MATSGAGCLAASAARGTVASAIFKSGLRGGTGALDDVTQRRGKRRRVDVQRIARFNRAAPVLAEPPAQLAAGQQPTELVDPFVFARGEKPVLAVLNDLAVDADGGGDDRHAARHELDGLEPALASRPLIVAEWVDADVAGVEQLHLGVERPRRLLGLDAVHVKPLAGAAHPQPERMPLADRAKDARQAAHVPRRRRTADPADHRLARRAVAGKGLRHRYEPRRVDAGRDDG